MLFKVIKSKEVTFRCFIARREQFYRATACNATYGIAVGILSVCPFVRPSVCPSDACIVTKLNNTLRIF